MNNFFKVLHNSTHLRQGSGGQEKSKARLGEIRTDHGVIKTPRFIAAATKGTIKTLTPQQVKEIGIQGACVNTYHLVTHPGTNIIEKAGGIHKYSQLNMPLMSDSGGFQVFSLASSKRQFAAKAGLAKKADVRGEEQPFVVKISEDGVKFRSTFDGQLIEFTPEKSMEFQWQIGADINMAFDECTYYPATHEYAKKAMERTHEWLKRCMNYVGEEFIPPKKKGDLKIAPTNNQYLYGVIQGATFEDLRKKSAEFIVTQNTPGVAIGGVSVGESKKEMRDQVRWVSDFLPKDRPVHLLGVGQIDDIIDLVKYGVDTFDCVEPTRLARMGIIYQMGKARYRKFFDGKQQTAKNLASSLSEQTDITKLIYKYNLEKVDEDCDCYVCKNFTKSYLHHLFKQREILGYTLATFHNLWVMEKLFEEIREAIGNNLI